MRDARLQGEEAVIEGSGVWRRKPTITASSSADRLVDVGCRGQVGRKPGDGRFFHFATILGLMP